MSSKKPESLSLQFHALTPERWSDLENLFGKRGACGGCWCMWWRLARKEFIENKGEGNRRSLKSIVDSGGVPGIIAYHNGQPVGWCALGPRETYSTLERSRILKRVDDKQTWSVVCFFIAKQFRHKGVTINLLKAAVDFALQRGARFVEGYPTETKRGRLPDPFVYMGVASTFRKAGFAEVIRRSEARPIMRYTMNSTG
jgi:GNAT superfamily N-acetyltransferase